MRKLLAKLDARGEGDAREAFTEAVMALTPATEGAAPLKALLRLIVKIMRSVVANCLLGLSSLIRRRVGHVSPSSNDNAANRPETGRSRPVASVIIMSTRFGCVRAPEKEMKRRGPSLVRNSTGRCIPRRAWNGVAL